MLLVVVVVLVLAVLVGGGAFAGCGFTGAFAGAVVVALAGSTAASAAVDAGAFFFFLEASASPFFFFLVALLLLSEGGCELGRFFLLFVAGAVVAVLDFLVAAVVAVVDFFLSVDSFLASSILFVCGAVPVRTVGYVMLARRAQSPRCAVVVLVGCWTLALQVIITFLMQLLSTTKQATLNGS